MAHNGPPIEIPTTLGRPKPDGDSGNVGDVYGLPWPVLAGQATTLRVSYADTSFVILWDSVTARRQN